MAVSMEGIILGTPPAGTSPLDSIDLRVDRLSYYIAGPRSEDRIFEEYPIYAKSGLDILSKRYATINGRSGFIYDFVSYYSLDTTLYTLEEYRVLPGSTIIDEKGDKYIVTSTQRSTIDPRIEYCFLLIEQYSVVKA